MMQLLYFYLHYRKPNDSPMFVSIIYGMRDQCLRLPTSHDWRVFIDWRAFLEPEAKVIQYALQKKTNFVTTLTPKS